MDAINVAPALANRQKVEMPVENQDDHEMIVIDDVWSLPDLTPRQKSEIERIERQLKASIRPMKKEMLTLRSQVSKKKNYNAFGADAPPGTEIGGAIMAGLIKVERPEPADDKKSATESGLAKKKTPDASASKKRRELKHRARLLKQKIKQIKQEARLQIMSLLTPAQKARLPN